jgi:hypothetical protein
MLRAAAPAVVRLVKRARHAASCHHAAAAAAAAGAGLPSLYGAEPWGRPFSAATAPVLLDEADVAHWRFGSRGDPEAADQWIRMGVRRPAFACPACGTPFEQLRHLIGHLRLTGHVRLPLPEAGEPMGVRAKWLQRNAPLFALADEHRAPTLALLPFGAGARWLRAPEHLLDADAAAAERRRWRDARAAREELALRRSRRHHETGG